METDSYITTRNRGISKFKRVKSVEGCMFGNESAVTNMMSLHWLGKGGSDAIILRCSFNDESYDVILKILPKTAAYKSKRVIRIESNELRINRLLQRLVMNHMTPCILLTSTSFTCSSKTFHQYTRKISNIRHHMTTKQVKIFPMEMARYTVGSYLQTEPKLEWYRVILFKMLYTIACIQHVYPSFRHNDLHLDNIFLVFAPTVTCERYHVDSSVFTLPAVTYIPCIADFGWAYIKTNKSVIYANTFPDQQVLKVARSPLIVRDNYTDVHTLLTNLLDKLEFYNIECPTSVRNFIRRVIPLELMIRTQITNTHPLFQMYQTTYNRPDFITKILLHDDFFKPFRRHVSKDAGNHWYMFGRS